MIIRDVNFLYNYNCYIARYTAVWNRHRESKNTKFYEIGSGTKLFITLELKRFFDMRRERHNLSMLTAFTLSALYPTNAWRPLRTKSSGLAQLWKSTFFFRGGNSTNCFFSNLSPRFWCVMSPKYPGPNSYLGFLFWHLWMTNPLRARVNTCVNVAPN